MGAKTWRLLGEYNSVTTAYTALAGPAASSPYTPDFSGKLLGLRAIVNRSAATSLINHVQFRLTSTTFNPNTMHVGAQGTGLQTAPSQQQLSQDWQCEQPIQSGVPVTIEAKNNTTDTPVTVSVMLYGYFEVS